MTTRFNERFTPQQEQRETGFNTTSVGASTDSTTADDGIDHALLQDLLFEDSSTGYHASTASTSPPQSESLHSDHGANSCPDGTCTLAMLELNHFPTPVTGAEAGDRNVFAPQPDTRASTDLVHGFGQGCPPDDSAFPLSTDLSAGQPGYVLGGYAQLAEQTGATPSFYIGGQPCADTPAAVQPIGSIRTTYASVSGPIMLRRELDTFPVDPRLLSSSNDNPECSTTASSWEMRDNKYFCLHAGCRNPSFKRLGDLERHQNNVHAQTKFFWCRYDGCGRGHPFARKDKRNEHERKVHHVDYSLAENF